MDEKIYRAAAYYRLSKEDPHKSPGWESNSIKNQRLLIETYLKNKPDLELVAEYEDDGYSGLQFDRPGLTEMFQAIRRGLVNCVIVKDLTRFGRDYIQTGQYLKTFFPEQGVRFIAVCDDYDSLYAKDRWAPILLPFKTLISDYYSRDISLKTRSHLDVKRKNGICTAPFAAYGYRKDPTRPGVLVRDEAASGVVKKIFQMKLDGYSPQSIADWLNGRGVLSPSAYKKACGSLYQTGFQKTPFAPWSAMAVRRILSNELYTGALVQGKVKKPNYKVKKSRLLPASQWIRVANCHEPLVNSFIFRVTQALLDTDLRRAPGRERAYPLSGLLVCGLCGQSFVRKGEGYVCSTYKRTGECRGDWFGEKQLEACVTAVIRVGILADQGLCALERAGKVAGNRRLYVLFLRQVRALHSRSVQMEFWFTDFLRKEVG